MRSKRRSLTGSEFTEIESLAKAQERVSLIRAGLDPASLDDPTIADKLDAPLADAVRH